MVCYCPDIGLCEVYNYSIPLYDLITNDTHEGDHNREYHFTFQVMNEAHLTTFERVSAGTCNIVPTTGSSDTHVESYLLSSHLLTYCISNHMFVFCCIFAIC